MNLSDEYLAGLFDGEGCVSIIKHKNKGPSHHNYNYNYQLLLTLAQVDPYIISRLEQEIGGRMTFRKSKKPQKRDSWYWFLTGHNAVNFLQKIYSYSIIKKEEIQQGIEFGLLYHKNDHKKRTTPEDLKLKEHYYKNLQFLKRRLFVWEETPRESENVEN